MLESLINLGFNASLSLLPLRAISGNDPLSFGEADPDCLQMQNVRRNLGEYDGAT